MGKILCSIKMHHAVTKFALNSYLKRETEGFRLPVFCRSLCPNFNPCIPGSVQRIGFVGNIEIKRGRGGRTKNERLGRVKYKFCTKSELVSTCSRVVWKLRSRFNEKTQFFRDRSNPDCLQVDFFTTDKPLSPPLSVCVFGHFLLRII